MQTVKNRAALREFLYNDESDVFRVPVNGDTLVAKSLGGTGVGDSYH